MAIRNVVLTVLVTFLWAICFPLIQVGLTDAPPMVFAAMRAALSGVLVIVLAVGLGRPWPSGVANLGLIVATGLTFTGLGLGGMFIGGGKIPPGLATVVANTQPLIAAVLAAIFLSERLTLGVGIGLLLGFVGVLVMSVPSLLGPNSVADLQAFVWIILGAIGTAMGNVLLKALTGRADVLMVTGLQLLVGAMALAVGAQAVGTSWHIAWTSQFIASLIGLVVFGTALMTALWHYLLTQASLNRLNTFTFLTPIFGLLLGGLFFDERFGWIQAVGIGVTILAIQLVATKPSPTR